MSSRKQLKLGEDVTIAGTGEKIPLRSAHAVEVARLFGLGQSSRRRRKLKVSAEPQVELDLEPGTVTLITGPSGAGKSVLLRRLREQQMQRGRPWIDLERAVLDDAPVVDCFGEQEIAQTLTLLSRV